jgi:capsular polysaccharide biosynthesis protein
VTDPVIFSLNGGTGEPDRLRVYDDFAATEDQSADVVSGLVSLGFIKAAVRRSARFLFVVAVVGLLLGVAAYKETPHQYQASATLLLTLSPYEDPQTAAMDNAALAKIPAVAGLAVHELGLQESASSFLSTYSVTGVTERLLIVTASGSSSSQAVVRVNGVASAFLKFRANELQAEHEIMLASLHQQINQAEQTNATTTLASLQQAITADQTSTQPAITAAIKGSEILTVVPLAHSRLKPLITYAALGLIMGLGLGLALVVVRALVSDRLRRRDDIAYALDAPVKLSVGRLRARRWRPTFPGRAAKQDLDMRRVIAHLRRAVPRSTESLAGLAIIAVDNAPVVAPAVVALATSYASQGNQVVTVDLSSGAHMAHLLRVKSPGAHAVSSNGASFTIAVPDPDDAAPEGPWRAVTSPAGSAQPGDALGASYASADLLLSLVTLDPATGWDHLATWATHAVVVVSAGQSSAERVHAVGEMIRLAGTRLDSVVLIGADKRDESLGLTHRSDEQADMGVLGR